MQNTDGSVNPVPFDKTGGKRYLQMSPVSFLRRLMEGTGSLGCS